MTTPKMVVEKGIPVPERKERTARVTKEIKALVEGMADDESWVTEKAMVMCLRSWCRKKSFKILSAQEPTGGVRIWKVPRAKT